MLSAQGYPLRLIADILGQADIRVTAEHYERSDRWQRRGDPAGQRRVRTRVGIFGGGVA